MPKACSAINCPNRDTRENRARGLSFHSFPKAHELRKRWMLAVKRIEPSSRRLWIPGAGACLCSQHFTQDEFELYGGQKRLKAGVIPSVFSFKKSLKGQRPERSFKAMVADIPAVGASESVSPVDVSPAQAKVVELIRAEHQYSLLEGRTKSPLSPSPMLGSEREQDAAQRRLTYCRLELQSVLESLREQRLLCEDTEHMLRAQFTDLQLDLCYEGAQRGSYPAPMCNFAASLHLFSAKAYESVGKTFQLPEPTTLHMWLSNPDYRPGFSQQAFSALAERSQAGDQDFQTCSLLIGAMPLERKIQYNPHTNQMQGLVDFGAGNYDADEVPAAREALMLVAVGFQGRWIAPLGYFLLATLTGDVQSQLLRHCILKLSSIGLQVVSVTSDATAPNVDTARRLGVLVDGISVKSTFFHPANPALEIAYFFDPCHLLTLIHNTLQVHGSLQACSKAICWDYLLHLGALQEQEVLQAARNIGRVSLHGQRVWGNGAAQLFSESTAQALHFAASLGLTQFLGHKTTSHFITLLSAVFDMCSSRSIHGKGPKAPLSLASYDSLNNLCNKYENLLRKLHDGTGELLGLSRRRWGFLGFLINLRSLQWMAKTYLEAEDRPVPYLLTGWWSLDPLEWCWGAIRQGCEERGATTAEAFQAAYRHVLCKGLAGLGLDMPNLLDVSLSRRASLQLQASWPLGKGQVWLDHWWPGSRPDTRALDLAPCLLSQLEEDTITHVSCFVVQKLLRVLPCAECRASLISPSGMAPVGSALLCVENRGRQCLPAESVRRVIRRAEKIFSFSTRFFGDSRQHQRWGLLLELGILTDMSEEPGLFPSLHDHLFDSNMVVSNHYVTILQGLVRIFVELRSGQLGAAQRPVLVPSTWITRSKEANSEQSVSCANSQQRNWACHAPGLKQWFHAP
uniref:THAP-type domain-containing protein n=1 Tax=Pelusios castaneus TaxID=367368 RepID=A0A8C8RC60_9SAUR